MLNKFYKKTVEYLLFWSRKQVIDNDLSEKINLNKYCLDQVIGCPLLTQIYLGFYHFFNKQ